MAYLLKTAVIKRGANSHPSRYRLLSAVAAIGFRLEREFRSALRRGVEVIAFVWFIFRFQTLGMSTIANKLARRIKSLSAHVSTATTHEADMCYGPVVLFKYTYFNVFASNRSQSRGSRRPAKFTF